MTAALPADVAHALSTAVEQAYEHAALGLTAAVGYDVAVTTEVRQTVLDVVYNTIQRCARRDTASKALVAKLPVELLTDVFAELAFSDRVRTSHVCHAWRNISLAARARLWTSYPPTNQPHILRAFLDRAGSWPTRLSVIEALPHSASEFAHTLGEHLWHISVLMLRFPNDLALIHFQHQLFSRPAPQLTTFMFGGRRTRVTGLRFDNLFSGHAPLLTDFIWEDSVSLGVFQCFSNVQRFLFRSFSCDATIWSILMRLSPHLETLDVDIDVFDLSDREPEARYDPPKTLKQLSISATAPPYSSNDPFGLSVIAHESISCVSLVGLDDSEPSDWAGILAETGAPDAADTVHVRADAHRLSLGWTDPDGRARALSNLPIVPLADLPFVSSPFGAIRNLTVHKWERFRRFGERRILPEFKVLEVLSIVVDDDTFADPGTEMLCAPSLSTLRFATAKERTVSGSTVLSFMRATLKIPHRLSSVEFFGLTLDGEDDCQTEIGKFAQAVVFDRPPSDVRFPTGEI